MYTDFQFSDLAWICQISGIKYFDFENRLFPTCSFFGLGCLEITSVKPV